MFFLNKKFNGFGEIDNEPKEHKKISNFIVKKPNEKSNYGLKT